MAISGGAPDRRLCVAPMMDWTDRHCRRLLRLVAPRALLYTEMVTSAAVVNGDDERLLRFDPAEHPVALQLGGSDPSELATAARMGAQRGYDEINLNVGCPSSRVQAGRFGACLMLEPELVADCVRAMREAVTVPVTVKSRIGVDDREDYQFLRRFVDIVSDAGCTTFIVHARKAVLTGLSPKENRSVPPLRYDVVGRLRDDFPKLTIVLNGGVTTVEAYAGHLARFDGVMIGRAAYHDPMVLARMQQHIDPNYSVPPRHRIVAAYQGYVCEQLAAGVRLQSMTRHMMGLYAGQPGARRWRRSLSENGRQELAGAEVIEAALAGVAEAV